VSWWDWSEQWKRVLIGLERLEAIYSGRPDGSDEAVYDLYSFFLNCSHLRDWLAADPTSGLSGASIKHSIARSTELGVCIDFANRRKHVDLTQTPRIDPLTGPTSQSVTVYIGEGAAHSWNIRAAGVDYDALVLARGCVSAWRSILVTAGLAP
jgi:hypothetical protein